MFGFVWFCLVLFGFVWFCLVLLLVWFGLVWFGLVVWFGCLVWLFGLVVVCCLLFVVWDAVECVFPLHLMRALSYLLILRVQPGDVGLHQPRESSHSQSCSGAGTFPSSC